MSSEQGAAEADCLFCRIVAGDVPAELVHETDTVLAFRDITPQAPTHVLVVPRAHHRDAAALAAEDGQLLAEVVSVAAKVAADEDLGEGYRLVFNTGPKAGQTVLHAHLHLLGGRAMHWPPG